VSKQTQQFFEQVKSGEPVSFLDAIKEAASSLRDVGGQIWDGMKPMFDHGRAEAAAMLFSESHNGHVMYMKGQSGVKQGQDQEQSKEMTEGQRDLGREM
jgi:hypothetical protein